MINVVMIRQTLKESFARLESLIKEKDATAQVDSITTKLDKLPQSKDYTAERAAKLDNLDAKVSTRLSKVDYDASVADMKKAIADGDSQNIANLNSINTSVKTTIDTSKDTIAKNSIDSLYYTPSRGSKLDNLDTALSSRFTEAQAQEKHAEIVETGAVKRIQSGTIGFDGQNIKANSDGKHPANIDVTLPYSVNISRSMILTSSMKYPPSNSSYATHDGTYGTFVDDRHIKIHVWENTDSDGFITGEKAYFRWEVIEWK